MSHPWYARVSRALRALEQRLGWLPPSLARVTLGWIFVQSGWGKLHHLDQVVKFFTELGIPAPAIQAPFAAATELVCGSLVGVGLATRVAALPLVVVMTVALSTALRDRIDELSDLFGLAEYCYVVLLIGLAISGAGPLSLDALVARSLRRAD
jgi:putative oxidoreductase